MLRKLMITVALVGAAALVLPSSNSYAQTGTRGVGAPLTGAGPGTNAGDPGLSDSTGPGARPTVGPNAQQMAPTHRRHAKRTRHMRSTVGSSSGRY